MTTLCLRVSLGSRNDPSGGGGQAHLLEHLLMSAPLAGGLSFCEQVERLGGRANAETGLEVMLFHAQIHPRDADRVATLLCDAVLRPTLTETALDRERRVVLNELAGAAADPADLVQDVLFATLFAGHPLGRPIGGTIGEVSAVGLDGVLGHYRRTFATSPVALVSVGPATPDVDLAPYASLLPPPDDHRSRAPLPEVGRTEPRWPDGYAWVCFGARTAPADDPNRYAYELLGTLLSSSASSLLYRRLRNDRGLAYAFQAWNRSYLEDGAMRIIVGVDDGNGPDIDAVVRSALEELADAGPSADDFAAAQRQAEMSVLIDAESSLEYTRLVALNAFGHTAAWSVATELSALRAVTRRSVAHAAARVLDGLVTVVRPEA